MLRTTAMFDPPYIASRGRRFAQVTACMTRALRASALNVSQTDTTYRLSVRIALPPDFLRQAGGSIGTPLQNCLLVKRRPHDDIQPRNATSPTR